MGKVVFEIPQSDVPYELRYDAGNTNLYLRVRRRTATWVA
jgi:hypothetical protein